MRPSLLLLCGLGLSYAQNEAPMGVPVTPTPEENTQLKALSGQIQGKIAWATSRANSKHDIWIMNADGSEARALTQGDNVDWFARFSPDGQQVLFNRSKGGWTPENDAEYPEKWDLFTIPSAGGEVQKVATDATWGTWRPDGKSIVFVRRAKVYQKDLSTGIETLILDGETLWGAGVVVQEPNLSPDGKYLAATLRGSKRETGILTLATKAWEKSGEGCQIDWFPRGDRLYRMNSSGNAGTGGGPSEVLAFPFVDGKQQGKVGTFGIDSRYRLMDLPGRRSHEYFPKVDQINGDWLVWGATDKGHDHDIYDYELYLWNITTPKSQATRLTFHSGNDRWPDLWIAAK